MASAYYAFKQAIASTTYMDAHVWRFTPSSFRLILTDLYETGEFRLREQVFRDSDTVEFHVSLSRRGSGCPFDRLALARMTMLEQQEITVGPIILDPVRQAPPANGDAAAPATLEPPHPASCRSW